MSVKLLLLYLLTAALGASVGSFLNVLIHRLPAMLERRWRRECAGLVADSPTKAGADSEEPPPWNLWRPPSSCPSCHRKIRILHKIPLLSFLLLKGCCSYCQSSIPRSYPLVELSGILVALACAWTFGFTGAALAAAIFGWTLIAIAALDLRHFLVPDCLTLPLLWLGLGANAVGLYTTASHAIFGAAAGYAFFWLLNAAYKLLRRVEGLGGGDLKLVAALGAWLGWQPLPSVLAVAALTGALVGITALILGKKKADSPLPFAPWLAVAGFAALLAAELNWFPASGLAVWPFLPLVHA